MNGRPIPTDDPAGECTDVIQIAHLAEPISSPAVFSVKVN
jgi:hypothetical protein